MSEINMIELKRYNGIDLPNRKRLEWNLRYTGKVSAIGTIGIVTSLSCGFVTILAGIAGYSDWSHLEPLVRFFITTAIVCIAFFVVGFVMELLGNKAEYDKYFTRVYQGKVLERGTEGGGNYPLRWVVRLEGYTLANELTTSWMEVSAGEWHETALNDYVEIDLPEDLR